MGLQAFSWLLCLVRFGKITSYHSMLAKLTGLSLLTGILYLLIAGAILPLACALWVFVVNLIEEITMTVMLPKYHHDVWNLKAARMLRRQDLRGGEMHGTV
jgi:CDP-diacylglycerol--glycerol-3-phosphate 3-phosphatidyltransferase